MLRRNRTLTGCGTCRRRHVKCDETRPICQKCQQQDLECLGYERQLCWVDDDANNDTVRIYRRPLFSVADQRRMTQMTIDSLGQQSASTALTILESGNEGSLQGPFGVLDMALREASLDTAITSQSDFPPHEFEMDAIWQSLDTESATPGDTHFLAGLYDLVEESQNTNAVNTLMQLEHLPHDLRIPLAEGLGGSPDEIVFQQSLTTLSPSPSPGLQEIKRMPPLAPDLLRYFKENVQSLSFPLRNSMKCPWQGIYLPSAMSTFAELSINHTASHTRLSLFYSLLAASCLHMYARNESAEDLNVSGKRFKDIAAQHLGLAMNKEVLGPGRAKYKEILVATLSMVMLSIFHGENSNAQAFLVDAEYLIRIRGLPKSHQSVKVRSLHHVYTYIRIMAESTCGCALLNICPDRPSSSLLSIESSPISLRSFRMVHNGLDGEIDIALEKSKKIGQNDIHLEIMGQWNETLFEDIYGIPESLLALLSQVIRLANEQELLHRGPTVDVRVTEELKRRASALEQYILSWEPPFTPLSARDDEGSENQATYFKAQAMHQALILFYYRRIPNISAWILQDTVRKCLDFLARSDNAHLGSATSDKTIIWPGFVAACEALEPDLQYKSLDWLITAGNRTSLGPFSAAAGTAQCVWKARAEAKDYTLSWFDVMKHERCPIIAT
ncbi:Zn(II)2Cys6 transcription factor [Aspergillus affinis]|uniref:Zn(II)2Cys6 transcription factor n=1 Tax=Aspergillus affinis TaxID=1070780 RepID=UPI0022FE1C5C|nr:Zn(II)2Cys6 transcription factor [Aspergillus affinis]KAI9034851.1 Zn(II)2Cys6 transcription factor [Aspergillus affinis]